MYKFKKTSHAEESKEAPDSPPEEDVKDDDDFEESEDQRTNQTFLKDVHIPGTTAKDSITYRVEALRAYLEMQLGDEVFVNAYRYL